MTRAAASEEPQADPAGRLELAREVLRGFENRLVEGRSPAGVTPDARVLPVVEPLARLLPAGGLRRGSTVAVPRGPGSTSLLLALLAEVSAGGGWVGVIGRPGLGLVAAAEAGLRLERLALVPRPGVDLLGVTSALLDGLDLVVVAGIERARLRGADRQRLAARARQRGAVLLPVDPWPGADLELSCVDAQWRGVGAGSSGGCGRLRSRRVRVRLRGRGVAPGGLSARLLLPAPDGRIADDSWTAGADLIGANRTGANRTGADRTGVDRTGVDRSGADRGVAGEGGAGPGGGSADPPSPTPVRAAG